jgi:hypothetical protein
MRKAESFPHHCSPVCLPDSPVISNGSRFSGRNEKSPCFSPNFILKHLYALCGLFFFFGFLFLFSSCKDDPRQIEEIDNYPPISPDYINVTIPYNIAPLNFRMPDGSDRIEVMFTGRMNSFSVTGKNKISIPQKKWKRLLDEQKGDSVSVTVTVLGDGRRLKYKPFSFYVSADKIDSYLSYRLIEPGYEVYYKLQICQRNLENFDEKAIVDNNLIDGGCINCHTYNFQDPSRSFFHLRHKQGGTMIQEDGRFRKIDTATDSTISAGVYGNWHPGGRYIAFSTNVIIPEFHSINNLRLEVYDTISDVIVLDLEKNEIIQSRLLADHNSFETFPAFSTDGSKLFFCSAKALSMPENYRSAKYSLCSVGFDPAEGTFGTVIDTLVSSAKTGKTISEPKPSPDGKYILYTSFDYGNFPVWHKEADLHLLRLADLYADTLPIVNSGHADSYHSWSSGSRWFVFASKRDNGMYGKLYFAHIDENGKSCKPFLMPQKDPDFYDFFMKSYNIPELSNGPVPFTAYDVRRAFRKLPAEQVKLRE